MQVLYGYMAFDMSPTRVIDARNERLPVFFEDSRRPEALRFVAVERARAVTTKLDDAKQTFEAAQNNHRDF